MRNYKDIEEFILDKLRRELPRDLYYHDVNHTLDVLRSAVMIGKEEKISEEEMFLLKVAVLYHDSGFTRVYRHHEEVGCEMAKEFLPGFGISDAEIQEICGLIMATKIPQSPKKKLEYIIADADLEYLGTENFEKIGRTLFEEIKLYLNVENEQQWNVIQMNFLKSHHYFTDFCQKNREAEKQKHLADVIRIIKAGA